MVLLGSDDPRPLYSSRPREHAAELASAFTQLLNNESLIEQHYQAFIEEHSQLVPRAFVQNHGVHFSTVLRKLSFGNEFKSDLFFLSKSSVDWNCVFIELESPHAKLFRPKENAFSAAFTKGLDQIDTWRAWFLNPANSAYFTNTTLGDFQTPLHENPSFMKYVLVIGRRDEFDGNADRRRLVKAKEADDFKIMTYDSLMEDLQYKFPLYIAARRNDYIDVFGDEFTDASIFAWMEPERLRISQALLERMKNTRSNHLRTVNGQKIDVFRYVESKIRVRAST